jgi:hypothetical protein
MSVLLLGCIKLGSGGAADNLPKVHVFKSASETVEPPPVQALPPVAGGQIAVKPEVTFTATPSSVGPGGEAELSWSVKYATSVSIDQGIGAVAAGGTIRVRPSKTSIYTLTAKNSSAETVVPVTVTFQFQPGILPPSDNKSGGAPSATLAPWLIQPSGSLLPGGQPVSQPIGQFNLSGQGGSQSSSMGALQSTGSGDAQPPAAEAQFPWKQDNSPAGFAAAKPYFESGGDLYADTNPVEVDDSVFLGWKVANADNFTLDWGGKYVITIAGDRVGTVVIPDVPGVYTYTLTARNAGGSVSQNIELTVLSRGQRQAFDRTHRCRTFMVYPQKIKKGEPVYVYWNVLDAQNVFIENDFTGDLSGAPDMRDIVQSFGVEQYWPYQDTTFQLTHGDGPYSKSSYGASTCFVEVR